MSTIHERWELVEPFLFAHTFRDPAAFRGGAAQCSPTKALARLQSERRFDPATIAQAFDVLGENAPTVLDREEPLHSHIRKASTRWLAVEGDHWALRIETRRPGHEIIRWRGLTMLLPASIVIAGALAASDREWPRWVQALPASLAPREPVGHLHVHLGPMLPFEALWLQLWNAFLLRGTLDARNGGGISSIKEKDLPEIGKYPNKRQPGILWQWILESTFAARLWLLMGEPSPIPAVIRDLGRGKVVLERRERRAGALLALWSQDEWRLRARREARQLLESRRQQDRLAMRLRARGLDAVADGSSAKSTAPNAADDEVAFITQCLRRCAQNDREGNGETYARVFYQYLRVKTALYSQVVVDPWTVGLRHFLDVVQRDTPYQNVIGDESVLDQARLRAARCERPLRVEALEIHVPPKRWLQRSSRAPHAGHSWILSFVRAEDPASDDPDGTRGSKRWASIATKAGVTCRLLARCLAMRPSLLREFRGISVMNWERNGPVWLFETPFRRLIRASAEVAAAHPGLHLRPIQTAFHLGEDFDHLLSGLRQIFEPFEWGLIRRGDRIGHALALGRSPEAWCEENPWVRMRPWDRILDIGFVYWAFDTLRLPLDAGHVERMRLSAGEAIRLVFEANQRDPLEIALDLWLSLPSVPPEGSNRFEARADRLAEARDLRGRIMHEERVGRKALSLSLAVETKLELPVLKAVHDAVFARVAMAQVAIEVNPSSNLLIGGFRSIFEQPVFHTDELPIILNADDPLTFATSLADDHAYAWAGMVVGMGQSPAHATRRLEEAARCSMRYAFTEPHERPLDASATPATQGAGRQRPYP